MRRAISFLLLAATAAPIAAQAQTAPPPPPAEERHDRREVRQDRREVQGDRREVRQDRREVRGDARRGQYGEAARDQADQRRDQRDLRGDRRDLRDDRRDYRADRRDDARPGFGPRGPGAPPLPGGQGGYAYGGRGGPDYREGERRYHGPDYRGPGGPGGPGYGGGYHNPGQGRWNPGWRNDRRYDWQGWRYGNRDIFRAPPYFGPRGYAYRRFAPGYRIEPFFFARTYWLGDPWRYRLPPAYGSYRWVRYYDDVLLVDVSTGYVADVIPGFFWR